MYTVQMLSATHRSLKVASLKPAPAVGKVGEDTRQGWGGGEEPQISRIQLSGQPEPEAHLLADRLQHLTPGNLK